MKIVTIVGARPQFIKAAPVSKALRKSEQEILVNTGQHYDYLMSKVFFDQLGIPQPDYNLEVGSGSHGTQTGIMLERIENVLLKEKPDLLLVYGDTNSTLAGALAAAKLHVPVAHIEAGLRSYNRKMPEEINRVLTDHISHWLFCPTEESVGNLAKEGIQDNVLNVGDVMYDGVLSALPIARENSHILEELKLENKSYFLATIHRAENTDVPERMEAILSAFQKIDQTIIFPIHPRTRARLTTYGFDYLLNSPNLRVIEPVGYFDMLSLEESAQKIVTDSGGIQKEAYFLNVPCVTLREETEWVETVETGWNRLVGCDERKIIEALSQDNRPEDHPLLYGDGYASEKIRKVIAEGL